MVIIFQCSIKSAFKIASFNNALVMREVEKWDNKNAALSSSFLNIQVATNKQYTIYGAGYNWKK